MIPIDSITIGFAVVGAVYTGHKAQNAIRRAARWYVETRRPQYVFIVRSKVTPQAFVMNVFYDSNSAGQYCIDHPGFEYYSVRIV